MSKKYYVVWKGAKTGIFDSWAETKKQTEGRSDAQFMGFPSKQEAEIAYQSTYTKALTRRSLGGKPPAAASASTSSYSKSSSSTQPTTADINIYCDGACSPNPGKSGTGIAIYEKSTLTSLWYGLYEEHGTNNTAELKGLLHAFYFAQQYISQQTTQTHEVSPSIQILSDSKYSIDCITKWAAGWKKKGWTRGKGEEIKNLEIIQTSYQLYQQLKGKITIAHVKGHANIEGNELSDRMAVIARSQREVKLVQYKGVLDIPAILAMTSG